MNHHAIGLVELNSIAKGFEVCDAMAGCTGTGLNTVAGYLGICAAGIGVIR